jgi:rhodanese-related sulfurtransferase
VDVVVIDCRYGYEYAGGHIAGAVNLPTPQEAAVLLHSGARDWSRTAVVLHCEFLERAQRVFRLLRGRDREAHMADYPALRWPHLFVLQGGYSAFAQAAPALCEPRGGAYRPMAHPGYGEEMGRCHKQLEEAWARELGREDPPVQRPRKRRPKYVLRQPLAAAAGGQL